MRALEASTGEYVLIIGDDDDPLLRDCLTTLDGVIAGHQQPDCVSLNGYRYVAPGRSAPGHGAAGRSRTSVTGRRFWTCRTCSRRPARRTMVRVRLRFPMTTQLTGIRRNALARRKHGVFHSMFPDHYALCGLLLNAGNQVVTDQPLLAVGVSPSFGHYFFTNLDAAGLRYLGLGFELPYRLAAKEILNAQCAWLAQTQRDFAADLPHAAVDRGAYVGQQLRFWLRERSAGMLSSAGFLHRVRSLRGRDLAALVSIYARRSGRRDLCDALSVRRSGRCGQLDRELTSAPGIAAIVELAAWVSAGERDASPA